MITRLTKLIGSMLLFACDSLRARLLHLNGMSAPSISLVLYYHGVLKEERSRFARQMDRLIRHAVPINARGDHGRGKEGKPFVSVTIDDGLYSSFENAVPELVKRSIPFTIFVPAGHIGCRAAWMRSPGNDDWVLGREQLQSLARCELATLGSHCVTHKSLLLLGLGESREEIFRSKEELEAILRSDVDLLSFPHGSYSEIHVQYAKEAGYHRVFDITPKLAFSTKGEYTTGRFAVSPGESPLEFRLKMSGSYRWLSWPDQILRRIKIRQ